jgi:hypothetical protein
MFVLRSIKTCFRLVVGQSEIDLLASVFEHNDQVYNARAFRGERTMWRIIVAACFVGISLSAHAQTPNYIGTWFSPGTGCTGAYPITVSFAQMLPDGHFSGSWNVGCANKSGKNRQCGRWLRSGAGAARGNLESNLHLPRWRKRNLFIAQARKSTGGNVVYQQEPLI